MRDEFYKDAMKLNFKNQAYQAVAAEALVDRLKEQSPKTEVRQNLLCHSVNFGRLFGD